MTHRGHFESSLPIVVGIEDSNEITPLDAEALTRRLTSRLTEYRRHYPSSRFVLLPEVPEESLGVVRSAAETLRFPIIGPEDSRSTPVPQPAIASRCHLLIRLPRCTRDGRTAGGVTPASAPSSPSYYALDAAWAGGARVVDLESEEKSRGAPRPPPNRFDVHRVQRDDPDRTLQRTDDFNRIAAIVAREYPAKLASSSASLALPPAFDNVPGLAYIRGIYAAADAFALIFQAKVHRAFWLIFACALSATILNGIFVNVPSKYISWQRILLLPYLLMLLLAYLFYYFAKRRDIHDFFVECRTLAESARIQSYWIADGVSRSVSDSSLFEQRQELNWIRLAIRSGAVPTTASQEPAQEAESRRAVLKAWIESQRDYYSRNFARSSRRVKVTRWVIGSIFFTGVAATVLVLLQAESKWISQHLHQLGVATYFFPAISAAIGAFLNKIGLTYQADHYSRMLSIYSSAAGRSVEAPMAALTAIGIVLGDEALREIGDWAAFRRDRTIDEPNSPFKKPW